MRFYFLFFFFSLQLHADSSLDKQRDAYRSIELATFVKANHVSATMAEKKQRLMFQPEAIQFQALLMARPKPGQFSLAYDALQLWKGDEELPNIDHSAYVGLENGPVIGVYVTHEAAKMLQVIKPKALVRFYAVHIYNYANGPRLVIVAAEPISG